MKKKIIPDYSKTENQIGCGYCAYELTCKERDPKINKAKAGCKKFIHYSNQK
jgi:choline dehydrogenase-like flavoprotein